ncbi:MAG: glycosyltransferase family 4 protein [Candidatus Promineifilaceae bacterium]
MRLAINGYFWNRPNIGSGQYTRQLVRQLDKLVSDLEIVLVYPRAIGEVGAEEVPPDVEVLEIPFRSGHLAKVSFEQRGFPKTCSECGANLAHVPYWGAPVQSSVPTVVTVHDVTTLLVREYRRGLSARLYTALVSAGARAASHIITDSKASKRDIIGHLSIPEGSITAIPLAVGPEFSPKANMLVEMATRQKYGLPESYVLYLGGYEIHKNVESLLRAYTYVYQALGEDYPLVLAGKRPEKASLRFPNYEKLIDVLGLSDVVKWVGYIDEEDKPAVYRGASCFVFLSRHEGFGLPPLEAMACGVPVISSSVSSLPEVIGDAGFGLDPDDTRQIGGSIIASIVQEDLAAELKAKGLKQAAVFSWQNTAIRTLEVYTQVTS